MQNPFAQLFSPSGPPAEAPAAAPAAEYTQSGPYTAHGSDPAYSGQYAGYDPSGLYVPFNPGHYPGAQQHGSSSGLDPTQQQPAQQQQHSPVARAASWPTGYVTPVAL